MPDPGIDHDQYVTRAGWRCTAGRRDAIDEIADQFERPVPECAADRSVDRSAEHAERLAS